MTNIIESQQEDIKELVGKLLDMMVSYERLLSSGREKIISLGGDCDSVRVMIKNDPALIDAREFLKVKHNVNFNID